jgi:fluoride exporter
MKGIELAFLVIGAIIGACLRYRITSAPMVLGGLSISLLLVNVLGSFILGVFSVVSPLLKLDAHYTLFMSIVFCGSLTSMSSFALETCNLLDNDCLHFAFLSIIANVFLSLGALISGRALSSIILEMI